MNLLFYTALALTLFSALALIIVYTLGHSSATLSARTFAQIITPSRTARRTESARSTWARILDLIRMVRSSLKMTDDPALQRQFECAAISPTLGRDTYFAARFGGPLLLLALGSFCPYYRILVMSAGAGLAYLAPALILGRLIKKHRERVRLAIPDAIDLLVICVDAGLGLDQAMVRVGDELLTSHPAIHHEFSQINREQRAGTLRIDAWRKMAARTALPETEALVNMLMQTERFGTPIARALSSFGDTIRQKRRQRAEELAAKTTIKIIFPLVFFIFPCIFIVLLGPAAISIYRGMIAAGH